MNITDFQLLTGKVTKTEFEDYKTSDKTSGFLRISYNRRGTAEVSEKRIELFFDGQVEGFRGEDIKDPEVSDNVFSYKVEFSLIYFAELNLEEVEKFIIDNESCFKKDASVFFTNTAMDFLSKSDYKNIELPYQQ
jgi:hypothetical protein